MDDPCRETFYAFERAVRFRFEPPAPAPPIDMLAARRYVDETLTFLGRAPNVPIRMSVGFGRLVGFITWMPDEIVIELPEMRRRPWAAIHEAVHAANGPHVGHGPRFATDVIEAWAALLGWDRAELYRLAAEFGVALWSEEIAV